MKILLEIPDMLLGEPCLDTTIYTQDEEIIAVNIMGHIADFEVVVSENGD